MLVLYHGDTSVCSAKVRLALSEKSLSWDSRLVNLQRNEQHSAEYAALNPARVVPTLVDDGKIVTESSIILEYIEDAYPQTPLMPDHPHERARTRLWLRHVDYLHADCSTLSSAVKLAGMRARMTDDEVDAHLAAIPGEERREKHTLLMREGYSAAPVRRAVRGFDTFMQAMETSLSDRAFLMGDLSVADLAALPYVNRAEMLGMNTLWSHRPRLTDWLSRMRARPSFEDAFTRWASGGGRYKASPELGDIAASLRAA